MQPLAGKTALVTGASRGIGRGIAQRLARDGALVAVHYGFDEAAAEKTRAAIGEDGGRAVVVHAPLGEAGDTTALWQRFDAALREAGEPAGVDIIVNNAAQAASADFAGTTRADFDRIFGVNVAAPFFLVQEGLERLRDGGRIINISSGVTRIAMPEIMAYAMTKGALETFSRTLAQQLGPRGITVNSVSPGFVDTDINASWLRGNEEAWARSAAYSAFNRVADPAEIADVVAFLASADGRWVTGQNIDATGGSRL
jgi:3-oxoacyl-[acyl-carrier protein] reductase